MVEKMDLQRIEAREYLDATNDAAKRTRSIAITMVVASVLVFGGLINSTKHQWMLERLQALGNPIDTYVEAKIGFPPDPKTLSPGKKWINPIFAAADTKEKAADIYKENYRSFYQAVANGYIDSLSTRVPIFGFSIDPNDIGILGGVAFIAILLMYRFALVREVENLLIAQNASKRLKNPREFYDLISMRQVLTIPPSETLKQSRYLLWLPKMICALPLSIHLSVTIHDFLTSGIGKQLDPRHNQLLLYCDILFLFLLLISTALAFRSLLKIDDVWKQWWKQLQEIESPPEIYSVDSQERQLA